MTTVNLHLVNAETDEGENLDLFVIASSKDEALGLWVKHFQFDEIRFNPKVRKIPQASVTGTARIILWDEIQTL